MNAILRLWPAVLALLLAAPPAAWTQPKPDPQAVFAELIKPYRDLDDYIVTLKAKIMMPTMRVPDFSATLYFKKPDRFHIETRSFAPLPRNSAVFNPLLFDPAKNRIAYLRTEELGGVRTDVYRVEPRDAKSRVRNYQVWVGGAPGRILQVESLAVQGTKALVTLSYQKVVQRTESWIMPETVRIHITFPEAPAPAEGSSFNTRDNPISGGMRRLDEMTGEGDIVVAYSNWQINTRMDDRVFKNDGNR
jgi:outer membrane lipoprotein-sorting protein